MFAQPGVPRDPYEKIADAAQVHAVHRAAAPSVALHIPWDRVDDYAELAKHAADLGVRIGAINSNVFQDDDYMLGSVTNPDPASVARRPTTCSSASTSWTRPAPATSSCGSPTARTTPARTTSRARQDRLADGARRGLRTASATTSASCSSTSCSSRPSTRWTSPTGARRYAHCIALGPKAQVVIDTGHHAPGTNIEFIVAVLLRAGKLGGFDFNSRFYADDDLMVGSADPFQLFRIMWEVRRGGGLDPATGVAFMLDQCHNIEPKIAAQIRSVMNVQEATAKALLVDADALGGGAGVPATCSAPTPCSWTPTPPTSGRCWPTLRSAMGLDPDPRRRLSPLGLLRERSVPSGVGGTQAGWGA